MIRRNRLCVTMELCSDAIFGSGYSIPGGEDIAVCQDENGYPYLKGSTFKGLLRESLENWLVWTDGNKEELNALLGESGWDGASDGRKLHLTELRLVDSPADAESCYATRTFTSLEDGVVKQGTLHVASCIRSGLRFRGEIECAEDDTELVSTALAGIKWIGTMRNRGFGRVAFRNEILKKEQHTAEIIGPARCLRYRLLTKSPVLATDLSRSRGNGMESFGFIPGAAVRGMVISRLAEELPEWFANNRIALLTEKTRFLDAIPIQGDLPVLPSLKGFYEDKSETRFESILKDGTFSPGLKRAKLGSFCSIDGQSLKYWSADTAGSTRINLIGKDQDDIKMFQTRYLEPGQILEGFVLLQDDSLAEQIGSALRGTVWLGADRFSGFGKCDVIELERIERPTWMDRYGYRNQEEIGTSLLLLAVSPFSMLDDCGVPCGLNEAELAERIGVGSVSVRVCAGSVTEYGGYNRTWKSRIPAAAMYERGSMFALQCDRAPKLEKIKALEWTGIGLRRSEGFGEILFLNPAVFEGISYKEAIRKGKTQKTTDAFEIADRRRAKLTWIMAHAGKLRNVGLSPSQIGTLQALSEKALRRGGNLTELYDWLEKNQNERGAQQENKFRKVDLFVRGLLDSKTENREEISGSLSVLERLELLSMLCDFSRKNRKEADDE